MEGPPEPLLGDYMPRDLVPSREGPREEIATEVVKHDREWGQTLTRNINTVDAAEDARVRASDPVAAHVRDFEMAKARLKTLTVSATHDLLSSLPVAVLELYLLAEEDTQNRRDVLRFYPSPGIRARRRYLPETTASVDA
jgi:hypothetical protein